MNARRESEGGGLASVLKGLTEGPARKCNVARLLESLDAESSSALQVALDAQQVSNNKIRAALLTEGIRVSRDTISDHRRGRCSCAAGGAAR
jgi:hypothetical protein